MRLLLISDNNGPEIADVVRGLAALGHPTIYWLGVPAAQANSDFSSAVFHNHLEAMKGAPAPELTDAIFAPPEAEIIEQLHASEYLIYGLFLKTHRHLDFNRQRRVYMEMVRYWLGVLRRYQIEAVVFTVMPCAAYNYIIYVLAQILKIKSVVFEDIWTGRRALWYRDFWQDSPVLAARLAANRDRNFSLDDLSEDLREYYQKQILGRRNATPIYMSEMKRKFSGFNVVKHRLAVAAKSWQRGDFFKLLLAYGRKKFGPSLQKEYRRRQTLAVGKNFKAPENFVYFALHLQPERTTSPLGGIFDDQILAIEMLAAALPTGWQMVVKEHPAQWWLDGNNYSTYRYPGFYQKIATCKNVCLAPIATETFTLIKEARAIATITGTAGWEALLRGKPVLAFGAPWYRNVPGLWLVRDSADCQKALAAAAEFKADDQALINYLKSLDEATIKGFIDDYELNESSREKPRFIKDFVAAINQALTEF